MRQPPIAAAEAGCTTGLVTHYFSAKRELVGAALEHIRAAHERRAWACPAADPGDPGRSVDAAAVA
ncbi:MAG: hypothetical protein L0H84_11545, partial [Pseudonocardia sp.]|nr:hypothetical protein [Pseudonocardia sp.]